MLHSGFSDPQHTWYTNLHMPNMVCSFACASRQMSMAHEGRANIAVACVIAPPYLNLALHMIQFN